MAVLPLEPLIKTSLIYKFKKVGTLVGSECPIFDTFVKYFIFVVYYIVCIYYFTIFISTLIAISNNMVIFQDFKITDIKG